MENQDHIDYCSMPTKNPYSVSAGISDPYPYLTRSFSCVEPGLIDHNSMTGHDHLGRGTYLHHQLACQSGNTLQQSYTAATPAHPTSPTSHRYPSPQARCPPHYPVRSHHHTQPTSYTAPVSLPLTCYLCSLQIAVVIPRQPYTVPRNLVKLLLMLKRMRKIQIHTPFVKLRKRALIRRRLQHRQDHHIVEVNRLRRFQHAAPSEHIPS